MAAFVGRARELTLARDALLAASKGAGGCVLVEGEPGIGKTRLLREITAEARARRFGVFQTAGAEIERDVPFGVLRGLIGSPDPEPIPTEGADRRFVLLDRIQDAVEKMAIDGPLLLAVEDLHWADEPSLVALHRIARRAPELPLAVFLTTRPLPRGDDFDRLLRSLHQVGGHHHTLGPLSDEEVRTLLADLLGAMPGQTVLAQADSASGNPLFLTELIRALHSDRLLEVRDGVAEAPPGAVPPSLRLTIVRSFGFLGASTVELLRSAALLGVSFSFPDLAAVLDRKPEDLSEDLSEAVRTGIFVEDGDRLAFRHELVREAVYQDKPLAMRKALHRQAGRRLAANEAPATLVAAHMELASEPGDIEAVTWLQRAADASLSRSVEAYVRYLERALALLPHDHALRADIVADIAEPLVSVGRPAETESLAREYLRRGPSPTQEAKLRSALATSLQQQNRFTDAFEELRAGSEAPRLAEDERAKMLAQMSNNALLMGDVDLAENAARRALDVGDKLEDDLVRAWSKGILGIVASARGVVPEAMALGRSAIELADHAPERNHPNFFAVRVHAACTLIDGDEFESAKRELSIGLYKAERSGAMALMSMLQAGLAATEFLAGEWDDARAHAEAVVSLPEEVGIRIADVFSRALLARMCIARDELSDADEGLAAVGWQFTGPQLGIDFLLWARALLSEARGDVAGAKQVLENAWFLVAPFRYFLGYRSLAPDLVRLALIAGDEVVAMRVTEEVEEGMNRLNLPSARATALRCRGLVGKDVELLCAAVEEYRRSPRTYDLALACEDAGTALGPDRVRAAPFLEEALERFAQIGAERDLRRAERSMRSMGIRSPDSSRRRRAVKGWGSLTQAEMRVVELICEGLTNREAAERLFVSRRTVDTHVSHVFQKLGVRSRTELVARAARRDG